MLRLTAVTRESRWQVVPAVTEALASAGGWILDHHEFSNLSLCVNFEIDGRRVGELAAPLTAIGLRLSGESLAALGSAGGEGLIAGTLQMMFLHDEPLVPVELPLG